MLPFLGHLLEVRGRRWGVLFGMAGLLVELLLFALAAGYQAGTTSHVLIVGGSVLQGLTGVFITAINASIHDIQVRDKEQADAAADQVTVPHESTAYGALQVSQSIFSGLALLAAVSSVLSANLTSYTTVWLVFGGVAGLCLVWLVGFYSETIAAKRPLEWAKTSPWSVVIMLRDDPAHRWLAFSTFLIVLATTSLTTLQAFTVSQYHWSQTYSTVAIAALSPVSVTAMAASFTLTPRFGPFVMVKAGVIFVNIGLMSLCLARHSSFFVYFGVAALFAFAGAFPALMQVITSLAGEHGTGELLANVGAMALAAIALGNLLYGTLFRSVHSFPSLSFVVAVPIMLCGTYCASRCHWHTVQHYDRVAESEADIGKVARVPSAQSLSV
mmetsp:Transcript_1332/g.3938  ORF Transcript_1332/g.3938 Transcript_1332/m.3938 type:complete len:385 (-) Transcript_1332:687-1841(-)